ncbi:MAG: hypothetical protein IT305_00450 [Chloroflexi bacterium]|nr:hypothetical protein [Chloroflexota bacterium]
MDVLDLDHAVDAALELAGVGGAYLILRLQQVEERRLSMLDGVSDRARSTAWLGAGLHVILADGSLGFASTDDCAPDAIRAAVWQALRLAEAARVHGAERNHEVWRLASTGRRVLPTTYRRLHDTPIGDQVAALRDAQAALGTLPPGTSARTSHALVDERWRIVRSDGTDVTFATPRAVLRHDLTARLEGVPIRAGGNVSGADAMAVLAPERLAVAAARARLALRCARETAHAPAVQPGNYRFVVDHALAKGLAHEAIGHLCESDVSESILFRDGRLRRGDRLAADGVSVVDGPLAGNYADQPIGANGIERQTVSLITDGILTAGLGDLFSARRAGIRVSGACRAANYRDRPAPRMTNIRILARNPLPCPDGELEPEAVAALVRGAGLLDPRRPTIYLTGYRGGQAHPRRGDFLFAAGAAYALGSGAAPRQGATLSGLSESALLSVLAAFGTLRLDAIGTCSKDGSNVSGSGGSHGLLVLDADPRLTIGASTDMVAGWQG